MLSIYKIYIYNFYDILSLTCGYTHVNDIYVHVYKHIYIYIHKYEEVVKQRNTHNIKQAYQTSSKTCACYMRPDRERSVYYICIHISVLSLYIETERQTYRQLHTHSDNIVATAIMRVKLVGKVAYHIYIYMRTANQKTQTKHEDLYKPTRPYNSYNMYIYIYIHIHIYTHIHILYYIYLYIDCT